MTQSTRILAERIVKSWSSDSINYIIVAPPMSAPERLFNLLGDMHFITSVAECLAPRIAVARLARTNFSSEEKFVAELARQWNVLLDSELDPKEQLGHLTREVMRCKQVPVLLIERFHEAMERLGEEFGTTLRDLDKARSLRTVVEFPVSLKVLKLRWDANPGKAPFLNSDWGQGHTEIVLQGYSPHEISSLVEEHKGAKETANFLFTATGGLPELVDRLIGKVGDMDPLSYEKWVQSKGIAMCNRLVDWLDYPGTFTYTRLVAQSLSSSRPHDGPISLADHPWKGVLQGADGKTGCKLLAWASLDRLASAHDAKFVASLITAIREGRRAEVLLQLKALASGENPYSEIWNTLELLCKFHDAADPYSAERWDQAAIHLTNLKALARGTANTEICSIARKLEEWAAITQLMSDFLKMKSIGGINTLEQFVCTKPDITKTTAFLMLLNLRLKRTNQLSPYHAMKAVVEQPESLLQIYCQLKIDVCWWNFSGMEEIEASRISKILKKPYSPPKSGQTLSFFDMLCINLIRCDTIPEQERLVSNDMDLHRFEMLYKDRNEKVHCTAFVSQSDWNEYLNYCRELLGQSKKTLIGSNSSIELHEPLDCFSQLIGSLSPVTRH